MALTEQKRKYAEARLSGLDKYDSAIFAGCPERSAPQAACRLEKDPDVIAAMGRSVAAREAMRHQSADEPDGDQGAYIPAPADDPMTFLMQIMNDPLADPKMRHDAAKALMPYKFVKPGEKGKKEEKLDAAKGASGGKFAAGRAPSNVRSIK